MPYNLYIIIIIIIIIIIVVVVVVVVVVIIIIIALYRYTGTSEISWYNLHLIIDSKICIILIDNAIVSTHTPGTLYGVPDHYYHYYY